MKLAELTARELIGEVAGALSTPGGGSAAAVAGALGAALCAMTARLTLGREKYRDAWPVMQKVREEADALADRLLELADRDAEVYRGVMAAWKLPKANEAEKAARRQAVQAATKEAARVPLQTLRALSGAAGLAREAVSRGNPNCLTDAGTGAQLIRAAACAAVGDSPLFSSP